MKLQIGRTQQRAHANLAAQMPGDALLFKLMYVKGENLKRE